MNKYRYLIAFTVMFIGFLPMFTTALLTPDYLTLTDCICATVGFILAVHITESRTGCNEDNNP